MEPFIFLKIYLVFNSHLYVDGLCMEVLSSSISLLVDLFLQLVTF